MARPRCPKRPGWPHHKFQWWNNFSRKFHWDKVPLHTLTRSSNTMKVRFSQFGEVKVDNNIHSLDIDSSCEKIWERHTLSQLPAFSVAQSWSKDASTHQCRRDSCRGRFWSHGTRGYGAPVQQQRRRIRFSHKLFSGWDNYRSTLSWPVSSWHECRSMNIPAGRSSLRGVPLFERSCRRLWTGWSGAKINSTE